MDILKSIKNIMKKDYNNKSSKWYKYNPHWWEVGDKNLSKKDFSNLIKSVDLKIVKSFHNELFPYHLFYLLEKNRNKI